MAYLDYKPYEPVKPLEEYIAPKPWEPQVGEIVWVMRPMKVFRDLGKEVDVCDADGNCLKVSKKSTNKYTLNKEQFMKAMKDAVLKVARDLAKANNTVTTLEIKQELIRDYPYYFWDQATVSSYMSQFAQDGIFTYTDNGTYRVYSLATLAQVAATTGPVTKQLKQAPARKRGRPRKIRALSSGSMARSTAAYEVYAGNFDSITVAGVTVTPADIKKQKKSPVGYLTAAKVAKLEGITIAGKTFTIQ